MKKLFLFMLTALLSVAGFAEDISKGTIIVPSPFYGLAPTHSVGSLNATDVKIYNAVNVLLEENTDYAFDGFFADAECTSSLTAAQIQSKPVGTVMYVKVTGMNGYENELIGSFEVKPMELTVTIDDASKTYGDNDPASFNMSSVKDVNNVEASAAVKADILIGRVAGENVKYVGGVVAAYNYTASMKTNNNYIVKNVIGGFTINPKAFTDGGTVDVTVTANLTYNGAAQEATVVVVDKAKNTGLAKGTDYTIAWSNNINASPIAPTATITGKGNYAATDIVKTFAIGKAPLLVAPSSTKEYNGNSAFGEITYTYQGFVDNKTAADVKVGTAEGAPADPTFSGNSTNVGQTTMKITNVGNAFVLDNYEFFAIDGKFTITKKTVTVTANDDLNHEYGTAENFEWTKTIGTYVAADGDALDKLIKINKAGTANANGEYALTPAFKSESEITNSSLTDAQKTAAIQARKNYTLNAVAGKLTYNNASMKIALDESKYTLTKVYDGQPVSITLNKKNIIVIGAKNNDKPNLDNLTLTIVDNAANVGKYQLVLSGATAPNYNITYIPSQFEITKKDLKVTTYKQVFRENEVPELNDALYTIDEEKGLADTDKASEVFKLAIAGVIWTGTDPNKIADGSGNGTIDVVDAGIVGTKWGNYNVTKVQGTAVTLANTALKLDDRQAYTDWAATPAGDPTPASQVMFTKRTLNVESWNVLVLPFEVTVAELSQAFGYAVIDELDKTADDGNVHFKLKVSGKIAANTPFLIYPSDDNQNLNQIVFDAVTYKKPAQATYEVADAAGNKFVGVYKNTDIENPDWYLSGGMFYTPKAGSKATIKPLRAYVKFASAAEARSIFIEEPDGTTTAIEGISAEGVAVPANNNTIEGIYNLNGVRVNKAQKGVYIINGKKVVK